MSPSSSRRPSKGAVEQTLEHLATEAAPAPDAQFLAQLEQRIASFADPAVTMERRPTLHRLRARVLLAVGAVGAAAAAAVMALSPGGQPGLGIASDSLPTTTTIAAVATTVVPPTTVANADGDFVQTNEVPSTMAPTTSVETVVPVQTTNPSPPTSRTRIAPPPTVAVTAATVVVTPVPTTVAATTSSPTTVAVTTSSPTTLQLTCARQGPTAIVCSWSTWPGTGVTYRLGRVSASAPTSQVLFQGAAPTTFTDRSLRSGETATYRVQALAADGSLLTQSNLATVP